MSEAKLSKRDFKKLCPVLLHIGFGLCIVMPRTQPLTQAEFDAEFPTPEAWSNFMDTGYEMLPGEAKVSSHGWLNGSIVLIDYEEEFIDPPH